ncbi:MAG: hypothetical protein HY716_02160 [Planctomycetes bacterium]|nr:hypothetical protein [Planctomycetota bacterium]
MKCLRCAHSSDGYAILPGVGEAGEIRFFCDACARTERMKLRYWDGRDLDMGGHRDQPDLGTSFYTLIFSFEDVARMRWEDLSAVLDWADDGEIAAALAGTTPRFQQQIWSALTGERAARVREILRQGSFPPGCTPEGARKAIVDLIRKL